MITKQTTEANKPHATLLAGDGPLKNRLLVAVPSLQADAFAKSVIYVCAHSPAGAMGIVVNQKMQEVNFKELLEQLRLPHSEMHAEPIVHFGGPVETGRGFVLHSTDFVREDTVKINEHIGITGTVDILRAIAEGVGPSKSIFALGYAGWGPGQLDAEMQSNSWLVAPPDDDLIFNPDLSSTWARAMMKMGIDPFALSSELGHS